MNAEVLRLFQRLICFLLFEKMRQPLLLFPSLLCCLENGFLRQENHGKSMSKGQRKIRDKETTGSRRLLVDDSTEALGNKTDWPAGWDESSCEILIPLVHNLIKNFLEEDVCAREILIKLCLILCCPQRHYGS